jgi:hypothetical protein
MLKKNNESEELMSDTELHIERLINRRLDGEMSAEESLEFDKLLLRDPGIRERLEASREIDALAAAALSEELAAGDAAWPCVRAAASRPSRWTGFRHAGLVAAAACLVLWALWPTLAPPQAEPLASPPARNVGPAPQIMVTAPQVQDRVELEYLGVMSDDSDKMYLLEIRRSEKQADPQQRSTRKPRQGGEL